MAPPVQQYVYDYATLAEATGMTTSGVSQHVSRGNLDPNDLVSVAAFLARHGTEEVRLRIIYKMMMIDRQVTERHRPQSTEGIPRTHEGKLEPTIKKRDPKKR
jgi:hypothetical protein